MKIAAVLPQRKMYECSLKRVNCVARHIPCSPSNYLYMSVLCAQCFTSQTSHDVYSCAAREQSF